MSRFSKFNYLEEILCHRGGDEGEGQARCSPDALGAVAVVGGADAGPGAAVLAVDFRSELGPTRLAGIGSCNNTLP